MDLSVGKLVDSLFGSVLTITMASLLPWSYCPEIPVSQSLNPDADDVGWCFPKSEPHHLVVETVQLLFDEIPHVDLA